MPLGGLLLLCAFMFFWRLGSVPLFDLDEGLYVSCSRIMVKTGDLITPRLNARTLQDPNRSTEPFYEKPIGVYWLCAASLAALGMNEWAARLPVALLSLAMTLLVYTIGCRHFGRRAGLLAGIVYATAPMTLIDARQMTTDAVLVTWFTMAMVGFWLTELRAHSDCPNAARRLAALAGEWTGPILFWAGCGLSVLTKGAVGLLLPWMVICVYTTVTHRQMSGLIRALATSAARLRPGIGILLFLVIVVPWHASILRVAETDANGRTWFQEYILRQHIGRFRGLDKVHNAPLPSYLLYFLVGFFPWACVTPAAFLYRPSRIMRDPPSTNDRFRTFLLTWFWTIFLFFTAGAAKLPTYIVPAYPAAALLTGRWLAALIAGSIPAKQVRSGFAAMLAVSALLLLATLIAPRFSPRPVASELLSMAHLLAGGITACILFAFVLIMSGSRAARMAAIGTLAGCSVILIGIGCSQGYRIARKLIQEPYQSLATAANGDAQSGIPVLYFNIYPRRPSMLFYANYSPIEERGMHLEPMLDAVLSSATPEMDVIASQATLHTIIEPDMRQYGKYSRRILHQTGDVREGWVLLRISKHTGPPATTQDDTET